MKRNLLFVLIICILASCNSSAPTTEGKKTGSETDNETLVKKFFERFNAHDWPAMAAMYIDTANFKDPSLGPGIVKQTRQQTIEKYAELNKVFPDIHDEVIQTYPSGDKNIIVEFVSSGISRDSVKFELPICTIFTIENGLITQDFTYFDNFDEHSEK